MELRVARLPDSQLQQATEPCFWLCTAHRASARKQGHEARGHKGFRCHFSSRPCAGLLHCCEHRRAHVSRGRARKSAASCTARRNRPFLPL